MKWHITRKRLLATILALFLLLLAFGMSACTKRDEEAAKKAGGVVAGLFGLPPGVGEGLVAVVIAASHAITGKVCHTRGRRKERACQVPKASP
jgi:hypothetical protein